jgi:hypothetical protein
MPDATTVMLHFLLWQIMQWLSKRKKLFLFLPKFTRATILVCFKTVL